MAKMSTTITNMLKLSPTHFVFNIRHQNRFHLLRYDSKKHVSECDFLFLKTELQTHGFWNMLNSIVVKHLWIYRKEPYGIIWRVVKISTWNTVLNTDFLQVKSLVTDLMIKFWSVCVNNQVSSWFCRTYDPLFCICPVLNLLVP